MKRLLLSTVLIALLVPAATYCQRLGIRAGVLDPEGFEMTFTYGGFGSYQVSRYLEIEAGIDYWGKDREHSYYDPYGQYGYRSESSASDLSFSTYTKYTVPLNGEEFIVGIGAGFGAHFVSTRELYMEGGMVVSDRKDSATHPGMHFLVEGSAPLSSEFKVSTRFKMGAVPDLFRVDLTTALAFKL